MKKNLIRYFNLALCLVLAIGLGLTPAMAEVHYMPGVTDEMTRASYWSGKAADPDVLLADMDQILDLNQRIAEASGTGAVDLRTLKDTVNGIEKAQKLKASAEADAAYYLGWTYTTEGEKADQAYYDRMIENTVDPDAQEVQPVKYAVAANHTTLNTFPSDEAIYDDPADLDFDYQYLSSVRVNEPLVIQAESADGAYYMAVSACCSGWVPAEDVAICSSREEWLSAWDVPAENTLVVTGERVFTTVSNFSPETSRRMLAMGTVLERADPEDPNVLVTNRAAYYNHVVYLPVRDEDGSYRKVAALIAMSQKVHEGYLPLTTANIASVAMNALGNSYGWGGMMESNDCSGFLRDVYHCFGLELARNTTWQTAMPVVKKDLSGMCAEDKQKVLDALPLGTGLFFRGHMMMYLGSADGNYYVLSNVSSMMDPQTGTKRQRIRSCGINTLDVRRASGNTWLQEISVAIIPYLGEDRSGEVRLPADSWYKENVAYCMSKGIMAAPDGYFRPDEAATRAEIVEALWRADGKPEAGEDTPAFDDVPGDASYADAVRWARENGVVNGVSETAFSPQSNVTREQIAAILYRYAGYKGTRGDTAPADLSAYTDKNKVSSWAVEAMGWCVGTGLIKGTSATKLSPQGNTTRAQLAVLMQRITAPAEGSGS